MTTGTRAAAETSGAVDGAGATGYPMAEVCSVSAFAPLHRLPAALGRLLIVVFLMVVGHSGAAHAAPLAEVAPPRPEWRTAPPPPLPSPLAAAVLAELEGEGSGEAEAVAGEGGEVPALRLVRTGVAFRAPQVPLVAPTPPPTEVVDRPRVLLL